MKYLANVATLKLNIDICVGCRMCTIVCPHSVFALKNNKANIIDMDSCIECGACAKNCPVEAIQVRAGVGCATGIIMNSLGKKGDCCCNSSDCCNNPGNYSTSHVDCIQN